MATPEKTATKGTPGPDSPGKAGPGPAPAPAPLNTGEIVKRGRGRPPGSKSSGNQGGKTPGPVRPPVDPVDPTFVCETATTLLEIVDTGLESLLVRRARALLPAAQVAELAAIRQGAAWTDDQLDLVQKSIAEIVRKHDWAAKYGPEILLCLMLSQYGIKQARVFAMLTRLEKEFRAARSKAGPAPAPAKPAEAAAPMPEPGDKPTAAPAP